VDPRLDAGSQLAATFPRNMIRAISPYL
jgi:hypothetical protein